MCACITGPAVLTIKSADDLRTIMDEMVQKGDLSAEERAFGEQWLELSCERQADGSIRTMAVLDGCTKSWALGAYLGDGHIKQTLDAVYHDMQVSTVPAASQARVLYKNASHMHTAV
jgi:hypothetical protein